MKFELAEPPEDIGDGAAELASGHCSPTRGAQVAPGAPGTADERDQELGQTRLQPVRTRMGSAIEDVRASMDLLRARVAERSMAEAHSTAETPPETGPGPEFHAHRFTSVSKEDA